MVRAEKKTWGDEFQRHVSNGRDHADAAYRADEWERQRASRPMVAPDEFERLHARGLELAKALTVCITAMNPPDRDGISMHEWNQRLKAATKQACAVFDGSVKAPQED